MTANFSVSSWEIVRKEESEELMLSFFGREGGSREDVPQEANLTWSPAEEPPVQEKVPSSREIWEMWETRTREIIDQLLWREQVPQEEELLLPKEMVLHSALPTIPIQRECPWRFPPQEEEKLPTIPLPRESQLVFPLDVPFSQPSTQGALSRGLDLGGLPSGLSPTHGDPTRVVIPSEKGAL